MSEYPVFCPMCDEDIKEEDDKASLDIDGGGNWEVHKWCAEDALNL